MSNIISIPKVANLDTQTAPQKPTEIPDDIIINNGFFPDISLLEVRNAMRIDGTVTNERLKHSLKEAIFTVNKDLIAFRKSYQDEGKTSLDDCDDEFINNESTLVYNYKRAVFCLTVANLYERYRSFDSTKEGHDKSDELLDTAGDLRRDYHFAVRDILGNHRMISELI